MSIDRVAIVEANLDRYLERAASVEPALRSEDPLRIGGSLRVAAALEVFEDQVLSRCLDVAARELKKTSRSFYTISSAGHEQNAVLGALLRLDDPCLLHYRSGALMAARARKAGVPNFARDVLLGICASRDDPASGGRHKVWGSRRMWVPPQTSTIASHLPKAVGLAFALGRARRMDYGGGVPESAIVCASFGDASANHATALSGINAARYSARRGNPTPILFVCEDNFRGISVETPRQWIRNSFSRLPFLRYFEAEGDLAQIWETAAKAIDCCRRSRTPVFLHLHCVRLWGHAGSDVETGYRRLEEIEQSEAQDPILLNARTLVESGAAAPELLQKIIAGCRRDVAAEAETAADSPRLASREEVMKPLAPFDREGTVKLASTSPGHVEDRRKIFGGVLPEEAKAPLKRTLAAHINSALAEAMLGHPEILLFGEDVGRKGGVYGVTNGLQKIFGRARVFDTLLDETTILGVAQGAAHLGMLPIPEIQYLAYLHNAIDQVRGEACSLSFFSNGEFSNPMVVRIAGLAYQKGFGGHFHNDNSIGALREIPGLLLVTPARGDDAARLMRSAIAVAKSSGRVVVFLEPIALYHERDLFEEGDHLWLSDYPPPGEYLLPGDVGIYGEQHRDLLIVSYANGLRLSLIAQRELEREHGMRARVIDLRWLNPLPHEAIRHHAELCRAVLVVDECRATGGGVADAVLADLAEHDCRVKLRSVRAADSYIPLGPASDTVLVQPSDIVAAALTLR